MAKPIKGTPTLRGESASAVLSEMRLSGSHDYSALRNALEEAVAKTRSVFTVPSAPTAADQSDGSIAS